MPESVAPEEHKRRVSAVFDLVASGYDSPALRFFPFCADRLVQHLAPGPGQRVLDIATGTGVVATALAQAVGASGRVHGVDLSENMLDRASAHLRKLHLRNVDLHRMDAEALEFRSRYFDAAVCSFGLFFLPDMEAALRQWHRVLKPGARVLFTSFTRQAFQPLAELFRSQLQAYGVDVPTREGWYRLADRPACQMLLEAAGFVEIAVHTEQLGYHLQRAEDWWEVLWNSGFRGFLEKLAPEAQARFREEHLQAVDALRTERGLWLDVETLFCSGRRPADGPPSVTA